MRTAIQRAIDEGVTIVEISRLAQMSRQGIYKLLRSD